MWHPLEGFECPLLSLFAYSLETWSLLNLELDNNPLGTMSTALCLQFCAAIPDDLRGLWDLNSWVVGSQLWSLSLQRHLTHRTTSSPLPLSSFLLERCDYFFQSPNCVLIILPLTQHFHLFDFHVGRSVISKVKASAAIIYSAF